MTHFRVFKQNCIFACYIFNAITYLLVTFLTKLHIYSLHYHRPAQSLALPYRSPHVKAFKLAGGRAGTWTQVGVTPRSELVIKQSFFLGGGHTPV